MNKLSQLKQLVDDGTIIEKTKTKSVVEQTIPVGFNGFTRKGNVEVYNVDKDKLEKWNKNVISFLESNDLSQFIEPPLMFKETQEQLKGNIISFEDQFKTINNLYELFNLYKNTKLQFKIDKENIEKNILFLLSFNKEHYIDCLIPLYSKIIGSDNFAEVFKIIEANNLTNISIKVGYQGHMSFNLKGSQYLTLEGKEYLKKMMSFNWKKLIGWILGILVSGGIAVAFNFTKIDNTDLTNISSSSSNINKNEVNFERAIIQAPINIHNNQHQNNDNK